MRLSRRRVLGRASMLGFVAGLTFVISPVVVRAETDEAATEPGSPSAEKAAQERAERIKAQNLQDKQDGSPGRSSELERRVQRHAKRIALQTGLSPCNDEPITDPSC